MVCCLLSSNQFCPSNLELPLCPSPDIHCRRFKLCNGRATGKATAVRLYPGTCHNYHTNDFRLDFLETIVVCVGKEDNKKEYMVYKSFATKSSKFLRAALNGNWKESQEQRVPLPDTEPVDFEVYLEWLYTSQLDPRDAETDDDDDRGTMRCMMVVRLYILTDFLDDAKFCNEVIDLFSFDDTTRATAWTPCLLSVEALSISWASTSVGSPLRNVLLEQLTYCAVRKDGVFQRLLESTCPKEVLVDLFQHLESKHGLMKLLRPTTKPSTFSTACAFHRHDDENPKCSESK